DGRCFWLKVHEIPQAGRAAKGKPIVNLINVSPDTAIKAMVPVKKFTDDEHLLFCTKLGTVKKTALSEYSNVRVTGVKGIKIEETLMVVTELALGKCSHIDEYRVQKRGGKGIKTVNRTDRTGDVVGLLEVLPEDEIMLITRGGQIIRSPVKDVRVAGRNTQ